MDNEQVKCVTKKITVFGIVQGVGFRPTVFRLAKKHNLTGTVRNLGGQVEIITQSTMEDFNDFLHDLNGNQENDYEIIDMNIEDMNIENMDIEDINTQNMKFADKKITDRNTEDISEKYFREFRIIESDSNDQIAIIPPDLSICSKCEKELDTKSDRRYENPFISCMACGPRYTIIEELPYDRHHTTMKDFPMCPSCQDEYTFPDSRRFHAQTISCNDCGPYLLFNELNNQEAFETAVNRIQSGGIIAVKGIGGYHYACSPFEEDTVNRLRKLKGREEKPFAVMFESIDSIEKYCIVTTEEKTLLESKARPIVLLAVTNRTMAESTNKGSLYCGAFLPYTALQIMLIKRCGPLIMTSANLSNKPIIKEDREMLSVQSPYLEGVLYHTRRIIRSVDDSVARIVDHKPQFMRRSRGYVPYPVFVKAGNENLQIFAAGSDLKAAYCIYKKGNAFVSQYFGDLEEGTVLEEYKESVPDLLNLLKITPDIAVCDMHPNYYSSKYAKTLGIPILYVQHHHAHIASVMAEHNLNEKVIGVAFDGTGYGTDGNIWGGEFLVCEGAEFTRAAHLCYTPIIGGDKSMRDGKKTAACFLINNGLEEYVEDDRSTIIKAALKNHINTVLASSIGRLFDAVAAILNIQDENRYEGECAIKLEKEAVLAIRNNIHPTELTFAIRHEDDSIVMDPKPLLEIICKARHHADKGALALGFHYAVADAILKICQMIRQEQNINTVALSGGVFQNTVLTEQAIKILRENSFKVFINRAVPPGDGSISLGQTFIGMKENNYVCCRTWKNNKN